MTWTKLGDEFGPESAGLTDSEFRTHVEALIWSSWRLLDLYVPKSELRRFACSAEADAAVAGLIAKGWWQDAGPHWYIGLRFPEWQLDRAQVETRRAYLAEAQRRSRAHKAGDHAHCLPGAKCRSLSTDQSTVDSTVDPGRDGTGTGKGFKDEVQKPDSAPVVIVGAEHGVREREARAKGKPPSTPALPRAAGDEVDGKRQPIAPSSESDDGPITVVPDDQHFRDGANAGARVSDRYAREAGDSNGRVNPFDYFASRALLGEDTTGEGAP